MVPYSDQLGGKSGCDLARHTSCHYYVAFYTGYSIWTFSLFIALNVSPCHMADQPLPWSDILSDHFKGVYYKPSEHNY